MADIKQIKVDNEIYDIVDDTKLPLTGGTVGDDTNGTKIDSNGISVFEDGNTITISPYVISSEVNQTTPQLGSFKDLSFLSSNALAFMRTAEDGDEMIAEGSIYGLANATQDDQAVPLGQVQSLINSTLASEMTFKGTASSLPSNPTTGDMYKVTAAISKTSKMDAAAKVGDTIIYNGTMWYVIPSGDDIEDTWRTIQVNGNQLLGGGTTTGAVNFKNGNGINVSGSNGAVTVAASYGTSATAVGITASAGTATTLSRSDHKHSLNKDTVTTALGYTPVTPTELDNKLDKSGSHPLHIIKTDEEAEDTPETVIDGQTISFYDTSSGYESNINIHGAYFQGGESEIVLDGFGDSGNKIVLTAQDENEDASINFISEHNKPSGTITGLRNATADTEAVPYGQMKEYSMPKYNEGIPTYQNDPELEGKNYCVDIPDLTELKVGTEITIIPHVTSTITGPSLTINGGEKIGMRVLASTTNSSFNGTRPDFMAAGAPVKLMYMERTTQASPAYVALSDGQKVYMKEAGTWANGYYFTKEYEEGLVGIILCTSDGEKVDILEYTDYAGQLSNLIFLLQQDKVYFSNGTDAATTPLWRIMNSVRVNAEALMSNNAEGGGMYPCTPGQANEKLIWNPPAKVGADINKNSIYTATSTNGVDYVINNVLGVDSLYTGLEITFKPNTTSTSKNATLNINGLGSAPIRLPAHGSNAVYYAYNDNFLYKNKPITVVYDATGPRWITANLNRPIAEAISGAVAVANGGTGHSTLTSGRYLVGNGTGAVTLKTKAQVLSDIGAVSLADFNALLARVEALESSGGGGTWQFTVNHQNFRFENGMTWDEFVDSTYNENVWCPECGEESQAFYVDYDLDEGEGSPVFYSESGNPANGCCCTSPVRLPVASTDTVYPMDYDLIMKALSSGGGGNVTFTYSDGNSDREFTVPAGTTWGQFISEGDYPMTDCGYGGHETSMFMTYNDASGGDGDDRVCGYYDSVCASCQYGDMGEMKFVYYEDPDEGYVYVYADDDIRDGGYYFAGSEQ